MATASGSNVKELFSRFRQTTLGQSIEIGAKESFGWNYSGFSVRNAKNEGFLGLSRQLKKNPIVTKNTAMVLASDAQRMGWANPNWMPPSGGKYNIKALGRTSINVGNIGRAAGAAIFGAANLAYTGYTMYQGYQDNGVLGAGYAAGESVFYSSLGRLAFTYAPTVATIGAVAGAGYAGYQVGEAMQEKMRSLRRIEFGDNIAMRSAGAATTRQRSVMALQNTHLNGRMALGNEAMLIHNPYR